MKYVTHKPLSLKTRYWDYLNVETLTQKHIVCTDPITQPQQPASRVHPKPSKIPLPLYTRSIASASFIRMGLKVKAQANKSIDIKIKFKKLAIVFLDMLLQISHKT